MSWLLIAVASYLVYGFTSLVDKYLLSGPNPNPKAYAFYVGLLGLFVLLAVPFTGCMMPSLFQTGIGLGAGAFGIFGVFLLYSALSKFEASRVIPAVGASAPIFTMALVYIFSGGSEILNVQAFLAFILLTLGSVLITLKNNKYPLNGLALSTLTAFFIALSLALTKYVYLEQSFWNGLIWMKIGGFLAASVFLCYKEVRAELLLQEKILFGRIAGRRRKEDSPHQRLRVTLFLVNQFLAGGAGLLKNWAIFLAPLAYMTIIDALSGVQHAFLLFLAFFISLKFPKILKEEFSKSILIQKILAALFIAAGLSLLSRY